MYKLTLSALLLFLALTGFTQTEAEKFKKATLKELAHTSDVRQQLANYDLSRLWAVTDNQFVYGFIGDDYQRIRIKFIAVKKTGKLTYLVTGKTMVKNNICDFRGSFTISSLHKYPITSYGLDNEYKSRGIKGICTILGDYTLSEDNTQNNTGVFKGIFKTTFYLDKENKIHYDDIDLNADGFTNNEFIGSWTQYNTSKIKRCNWGDYRIPNSGDLDVGAGEFSPREKYIKNGWLVLNQQWSQNPTVAAKAKKGEQSNWWK